MDSHRFDALTRTLAMGTSRRRVLKGLVVSLGAMLTGRSVHAEETCPVPLGFGEPCITKVGICHHTSSDTNPYRYIEVCVDAVPAHAGHGDLVACPTNQVIEPESCTCMCDPALTCGDGELLNPETCACKATCLPGFAEMPVPCSHETAHLCCSKSCSGTMCCYEGEGTMIC